MVFVFYGHERTKRSALFERLFRLRHQVFIVDRGWSLPCREGVERDQYDTDETIYFVEFCEAGEIRGHVRITPTMRSSLTADYFPHLIENGVAARGPTIFEATRFIVRPAQRDKASYRRVKAGLIAAATEWCLENGITHLQTVIDAGTLAAYVEISMKVTPLGLAHPFGGGKGVPGGGECLVFRLELDHGLLDEIKAFGALPSDVAFLDRSPAEIAKSATAN